MHWRYIFLTILIFYLHLHWRSCMAENAPYIVLEYATVTYCDKNYILNPTAISRRYNRRDPIYYVTLSGESLVSFDNNASMDFYFYEKRGNKYFPTYVELHFKFCDFFATSTLFGNSLKRAMGQKTCPMPPGKHEFANLTLQLQSIPKTFPYSNGRLIVSMSVKENGTTKKIIEGHGDLFVRTRRGNH